MLKSPVVLGFLIVSIIEFKFGQTVQKVAYKTFFLIYVQATSEKSMKNLYKDLKNPWHTRVFGQIVVETGGFEPPTSRVRF